jgi:hypothetical protein
MVISERSCGKTNQMIDSIDMLLQTIAFALATALATGYRLARCATMQSVVDGS